MALAALRTLVVPAELQDLGPQVAMVPLTAVPDMAAAAVEAAVVAGARMETALGADLASAALYPPGVAALEPLPL